MLKAIVATSADNAIGLGNSLLFRYAPDMKRFKEKTLGHAVVMGRKTFESLPDGCLPIRLNLVASRRVPVDSDYRPAIQICNLAHVIALDNWFGDSEDFWIIGGGEIYRQLVPQCIEVYRTVFGVEVPFADTFFPSLDDTHVKVSTSEVKLVDVSAIHMPLAVSRTIQEEKIPYWYEKYVLKTT